mmetsp:Transcript_18334/g.57679  ORF Transcript_18334/g.57679 Transcript_18334/m.57679 type:complete len:320 (+) Transcript_18334:629-1588(+)
MRPCDVVRVPVAPPPRLTHVGVQPAQHSLVVVHGLVRGALRREEHLGDAGDEVGAHLDLHLELGVLQAGVVRAHAPELGRPVRRAPKDLVHQGEWSQVPLLVDRRQASTGPYEQVVVLLGRPCQLNVLHLVVGRLQLDVALPLAVGHALRDQDEVGGEVADVAEVVPRDAEGKAGLQHPVGTDLLHLLALLVHGHCHAIRPRLPIVWKRDLGKQPGVQACSLAPVRYLKGELGARAALHKVFHILDCGHLLILWNGLSDSESVRQPSSAHFLHHRGAEGELQAVVHARSLLVVVRAELLVGDRMPDRVLLGLLLRAPRL